MSKEIFLEEIHLENDPDQLFDIDDRWQALCNDSLSEHEVHQLKAMAKRSEIFDKLYSAFDPIASEKRLEIADKIQENLLKERTNSVFYKLKSFLSTLLPFPGSRFVMSGIAGLSMVTLILVSLNYYHTNNNDLPEYHLQVHSGIKLYRNYQDKSVNGLPQFFVDSRIPFILRPDTPVEEDVEVMFFISGNSILKSVDLPVKISDTGSILVEPQLGKHIAVSQGQWKIYSFIAKKGSFQASDVIENIENESIDSHRLYSFEFLVSER